MWPNHRALQLKSQLDRLAGQPVLRFAFAPSRETANLGYFPDDLAAELSTLSAAGFEHVVPSAAPDVMIVTTHGAHLADALWRLRESMPSALLASWHWDNHLAAHENLATATAVDLCFPSHLYAANTLANPCSILAGHVPACAAQWTRAEVRQLYDAAADRPRSDRLLAAYVDYPGSWRSAVLRELATTAPEADVRLMPPGDRTRYFSMDRATRYAEWLAHKASLVLPVEYDLSTRAFDGLLAGQVLVVPERVRDFDRVIPPADQQRLDVVRLSDASAPAIRAAALEAARRYDAGGLSGARMRHAYVLERHMLVHRIASMLHSVHELVAGRVRTVFGAAEGVPFGLYGQR